ncbi:MAG: 50S ribosomal protein L24 [Candidatus Nomurabacteria bacterium]|jgi:large subunit ribosomal protein L24|nr:50S ribosomal protein L24 [Candidatus Nomurabacteria bacterium]
MASRIIKGDLVKITMGDNKGKTGKVLRVDPAKGVAYIDGIGNRERHYKANQYMQGGKREIQVGVALSKLAVVVDDKTGKTSRIGFKKNEKGKLVRIAKQHGNKEIK